MTPEIGISVVMLNVIRVECVTHPRSPALEPASVHVPCQPGRRLAHDYDAADVGRGAGPHMKILDVRTLAIPDVRVVRFARFLDARGSFTESYRRSDVEGDEAVSFLHDLAFVQVNESQSHADVVRGLHFQWNPFMGKLVRTMRGRMVDLVLDIRLGSPTFGRVVAYDMPPILPPTEYSEWIWVPPGFAHGNSSPRRRSSSTSAPASTRRVTRPPCPRSLKTWTGRCVRPGAA